MQSKTDTLATTSFSLQDRLPYAAGKELDIQSEGLGFQSRLRGLTFWWHVKMPTNTVPMCEVTGYLSITGQYQL